MVYYVGVAHVVGVVVVVVVMFVVAVCCCVVVVVASIVIALTGGVVVVCGVCVCVCFFFFFVTDCAGVGAITVYACDVAAIVGVVVSDCDYRYECVFCCRC